MSPEGTISVLQFLSLFLHLCEFSNKNNPMDCLEKDITVIKCYKLDLIRNLVYQQSDSTKKLGFDGGRQ